MEFRSLLKHLACACLVVLVLALGACKSNSSSSTSDSDSSDTDTASSSGSENDSSDSDDDDSSDDADGSDGDDSDGDDSDDDDSDDSTYTVGGSVTGLNGTLVLQNNSGDDETITTNEDFTFDTALADAASYEVTVSSDPNLQTCTVSSGTGVIDGGNVIDVTVTCTDDKTFGDVEAVSTSGVDVNAYNIEVSDAGYSVIFWDEDNALKASIADTDGTWTDYDGTINVEFTSSGTSSLLANIDDTGQTLLTWKQHNGSTTVLYKATYFDETWDVPADNTESVTSAYTNAYDADLQDGKALIAYINLDSSIYKTYRYSYDGSSWDSSASEVIASDTTWTGGPSAFYVEGSDDAHILFSATESTESFSQVNRASFDGSSWTTPSSALSTDFLDDYYAYNIEFAFAADGDDTGFGIFKQCRDQFEGYSDCDSDSHWTLFRSDYDISDAAFAEESAIEQISFSIDAEPSTAKIDVNSSGDAIYAFYHGTSQRKLYVGTRDGEAGTWTDPEDIDDDVFAGLDADNTDNVKSFDVAIDDFGNMVVIWLQGTAVYVSFYNADIDEWAHPTDSSDYISNSDSLGALDVKVEGDEDGNFLLTWLESDGTSQRLYKREYR